MDLRKKRADVALDSNAIARKLRHHAGHDFVSRAASNHAVPNGCAGRIQGKADSIVDIEDKPTLGIVITAYALAYRPSLAAQFVCSHNHRVLVRRKKGEHSVAISNRSIRDRFLL